MRDFIKDILIEDYYDKYSLIEHIIKFSDYNF